MKKVELQMRKAISKYFIPFKMNASIDNLGNSVILEPCTLKHPQFAGLQIIYNDGVFEFSEYMAGVNENELHVFGTYKTINAAIKRLLKGKKDPIKIWN